MRRRATPRELVDTALREAESVGLPAKLKQLSTLLSSVVDVIDDCLSAARRDSSTDKGVISNLMRYAAQCDVMVDSVDEIARRM